MRVLVVDDDPLVLRALVAFLLAKGFVVEAARSSKEALTMVDRFIPDVMVVDQMLGEDIDGSQLVRDLRSKVPGVPAVIISGYPDSEIERRIQGDSHTIFLAKPFRPEFLAATIENLAKSATSN